CAVNQPKVTFEGAWTPQLISGIWENVLQITIPAGELTTSTARVVLEPYIPQAGYYNVTMYTPSCIPFDCSKTTSIAVTISTAPGQISGPFIISQNNPSQTDRRDLLFSGFIVATTTSFQPNVTITVSSNAVTTGSEAIITVNSIEFEKVPTNKPLSGLFQYWPPSNLNLEPA